MHYRGYLLGEWQGYTHLLGVTSDDATVLVCIEARACDDCVPITDSPTLPLCPSCTSVEVVYA